MSPADRDVIEITGAAIDLNYHLIAGMGEPPPTDYRDSFFRLSARGILSRKTAEHLAGLAGLRNRLIHVYETIDDARVHEALRHLPALLREYLDAVEQAGGK